MAQDSATGAIRGTVLDSTGAFVPQASIVVVNIATNRRYSATSDAEGRFAIDLLPPGDYSARVVAQGMSPQITPQLHVDVGGAAELSFRLIVAGTQESLTVSGAPALVETKSSTVSTLLDERAVNDFPLNGRRFSDLALFSPGVTQDPRSLTSATAISPSGAFAAFRTASSSMAATSTTPSSPSLADAIAPLTSSPPKLCRSSASRPTLMVRSKDGPAAPW
jgi:hypothetical protein